MLTEETSEDQSQTESTGDVGQEMSTAFEDKEKDVKTEPAKQAEPGKSALDGKKEGETEIGPKDIPEELKPLKQELLNSFYEKTREVAKERKELGTSRDKAKLLEQLVNYQPFQEWYSNEQKRLKGEPSKKEASAELTEEQVEKIQSDPKAFQEYLSGLAEKIVDSKYGKTLSSTTEQLSQIQLDKQLNEIARKYPDFDDINGKGLLDEYVEAGHDYESAYALFKLKHPKNVDSAISKKAAELINKSKQGTTHKTSGISSKGAKVVKAKGISDAFDAYFDAESNKEDIKVERE